MLCTIKIDSVLNVGESSHAQLEEMQACKDKSTEWERERTPKEQGTVGHSALLIRHI